MTHFVIPRSILILAVCWFVPPLLADTTNIYVGGSYDGYAGQSTLPRIGYPSVNNAPGATNVTDLSAWLNGNLISTGSAPTTVYVYWGTTNGGTNKTSWSNSANFGVCVEGQSLSTNATLTKGTTYYYRFYGTNTAGEDGWADGSAVFATLNPPVVINGTPSASFTTAILSGNLTAGGSASITIRWGQNTNSWANTNNLGTCPQGVFGTTISGLSSGAGYYCRWYGTNAYGEGWSDTAAFTTRVPFAVFFGGSYDGYADQSTISPLLIILRGTVFVVH